MASKLRNRYALFFDAKSVTQHRKYKGLPAYPASKLVDAIHGIFLAGRAEKSSGSSGQTIYIADMKINKTKQEAHILMNVSDPTALDPTFTDRKRKTRRLVKKVLDEGLDYSAHIVIGLQSIPKMPEYYPFLLEVSQNLPSSRVERFLNYLLRIASKNGGFNLDDLEDVRDGADKPRQIKARPTFELRGQPSQEFLSDLKKGELAGLEIFTITGRATPWDSHGYTLEDRSSVHIKLNPAKLIPKAKAVVENVFSSSKDKYEMARIRFKTGDGIPRTVKVHTDDLSLVDDMKYVRKECIDTYQGVYPTSVDTIEQRIILKMSKLLQ